MLEPYDFLTWNPAVAVPEDGLYLSDDYYLGIMAYHTTLVENESKSFVIMI